MMEENKKQNLLILFTAIGLFFLWITVFQYARPWGGADMGRLYLAGATSLLVDKEYNVTQRPPLYSFLLASLGYVSHIDTSQIIHAGRDFGNPEAMDLALGFRDTSFRRLLLLVQGSFWILTLILILKTTRVAGLPTYLTYAVWAMMLIPSSWMMVTFLHDTITTQLLLAAAVFLFAVSLTKSISWGTSFFAGIFSDNRRFEPVDVPAFDSVLDSHFTGSGLHGIWKPQVLANCPSLHSSVVFVDRWLECAELRAQRFFWSQFGTRVFSLHTYRKYLRRM